METHAQMCDKIQAGRLKYSYMHGVNLRMTLKFWRLDFTEYAPSNFKRHIQLAFQPLKKKQKILSLESCCQKMSYECVFMQRGIRFTNIC